MKKILMLLPLIVLLSICQLNASECEKSQVYHLVDDCIHQFSQRYGCNTVQENGWAIIATPILVYFEDIKELDFLIKIHLMWAFEDKPMPEYLVDQNNEYSPLLAHDDKSYVFQITMFQWWFYMSNGLEGNLLFENGKYVIFNVPKDVFKDIDLLYEQTLH
jgi:hypothetical protein